MVKPYLQLALAGIVWISLSLRTVTAAFLPIVPAVHTFATSSAGDYQLPSSLRIVVDAAQASSREDNGLSLIPPTLSAFAQTFASDLRQTFPTTTATVVTLDVGAGFTPNKGDIILTILPDTAAAQFTLAGGSHTTEGYQLTTTSSSITISGSGAKGSFWGTRTVLQGLVINGGKIPGGIVKDQPDWETRGFMLDVGRQWYPITFLTELCAYASWFKMSEFHVHLSDNLPGVDPNAYARLRLRSMVSELTPHVNETYSREQFEDFQQQCAARGVTVIPEIESPGHALVISQWKPQLALSSDPTLLNLSFPDTIPTVKSIWQEFLPWIHSKQVSIGADEYDSALADDYNNFVNTMSDFISQQGQKEIRIWGTNEPSNRTSVSKNITIQHWDFGQDDPFSLIRQGYNVINSEDSFQYIVMKQSGSFPQQLDQNRLWTGANTASGGIWDPHVFDRENASNNPTITDPRLHGAILAAWNDHGRNASTYLEAFYSIKSGLPVIAAASWQAASRPNHLTRAQFLSSFPSLERAAPGQNLDRRIPSKGSIVVEYDLSSNQGATVPDRSGNGYTGTLSGGTIQTPLMSKGHNYTLLVNTTSAVTPGTLLTGPDDTFALVSSGRGLTLAFNSTNITYPLSGFTFPTRPASPWMEIIITGTEASTSAFVNGAHVGEFKISISRTSTPQNMSFVAPVQQIGGPGKQVARFVLWDGLQDITAISAFHVQ
ncbi:glycoside hydrolase [Collybia nuda]|uniref:beta-N-acetylhexosaminidase n=1 Tax=Collybia nuda TaxID=64659 RepID=A0A9P5XRP2_9AGAR|nr:glycoside hydrolase [Collybia nuda]